MDNFNNTSPAPYIAPTLYDNPPLESHATSAVITSPAPLAKANSVTALNASGIFVNSEMYAIDGARYVSTTDEIKRKFKKIKKKLIMTATFIII